MYLFEISRYQIKYNYVIEEGHNPIVKQYKP
jgi:hypothetical protein